MAFFIRAGQCLCFSMVGRHPLLLCNLRFVYFSFPQPESQTPPFICLAVFPLLHHKRNVRSVCVAYHAHKRRTGTCIGETKESIDRRPESSKGNMDRLPG